MARCWFLHPLLLLHTVWSSTHVPATAPPPPTNALARSKAGTQHVVSIDGGAVWVNPPDGPLDPVPVDLRQFVQPGIVGDTTVLECREDTWQASWQADVESGTAQEHAVTGQEIVFQHQLDRCSPACPLTITIVCTCNFSASSEDFADTELAFVIDLTLHDRAYPTVVAAVPTGFSDPGDAVALSCVAHLPASAQPGPTNFSYRWLTMSGEVLVPRTSSPVSSFTPASSVQVQCEATVTPGSLVSVSLPVDVTLRTPPTITSSALGLTGAVGGSASLTCEGHPGTGGGSVMYQWLPSPQGPLRNTTSGNELVLLDLPHIDTVQVTCRVHQTGGHLTTDAQFTVLVVDYPMVTRHPSGLLVARGSPATMRCQGKAGRNGGDGVWYSWTKDNLPLTEENVTLGMEPNVNGPELRWMDVHAEDTGKYRCVVWQPRLRLSTVSHTAVLQVDERPETAAIVLLAVAVVVIVVVMGVAVLDRFNRMPKPRRWLGQRVRRMVQTKAGRRTTGNSSEEEGELVGDYAKSHAFSDGDGHGHGDVEVRL